MKKFFFGMLLQTGWWSQAKLRQNVIIKIKELTTYKIFQFKHIGLDGPIIFLWTEIGLVSLFARDKKIKDNNDLVWHVFCAIKKNWERTMTTPQETRDRIKEMRERIFEKPGKESVETNIQETSPEDDLAGKEINVVPEQESLSINENIKETKQKNDNAEKKI